MEKVYSKCAGAGGAGVTCCDSGGIFVVLLGVCVCGLLRFFRNLHGAALGFVCAACCGSFGIFAVLLWGCVGVGEYGMYYGVAIFGGGDDICGL